MIKKNASYTKLFTESSWSGLLFTWLHLVYCKTYLPVLIAFAISILLVPVSLLAEVFLFVGCGIADPYLIYLRYSRIMKEVEGKADNEKIEVLKKKVE